VSNARGVLQNASIKINVSRNDQWNRLPLHCGILISPTSEVGQNENSPILGLCQLLPPAPDIGLPMLSPLCARTGREQVQQTFAYEAGWRRR
jgi:hypothetical protein